MSKDNLGRVYYKPHEVCDMLYRDPDRDLSKILLDDDGQFAQSLRRLHYEGCKPPKTYTIPDISVEEFDELCQRCWKMPDEYSNLDIYQWVLEQCKTEEELQRCGQELLMYQERNLTSLLQFMKYFVDTMRAKGLVWGVGRGSSVASYVLYLIGVHKVNSIFYDLDVLEFLK